MTANIVNQVAYLRTSRNYPEDLTQLTVEVNKSYVDIANAVNARTIGIFPTNRPAITGESWFLTNQRQQTLRQVYTFSSYAPINHNINFNEVFTFTKINGVIFTGVFYLPLPYVDASSPASSIGIFLSSTQILFTLGGAPPTIDHGIIILEWMSDI